jgi:hypothetical protein
MVPKKKFGNENVIGQNPNVKWWNAIDLKKIDPIFQLSFGFCHLIFASVTDAGRGS